jgi:hypothetical protein
MRALSLLLLVAGCDALFPEFAGTPPAATDLGGGGSDGAVATGPGIHGSVCVLGDVRDLASCGPRRLDGVHVTVEETRDAAPVDLSGAFELPLARALDVATLAAGDLDGLYLPTVATVRLVNGAATVVVPLVPSAVARQLATTNGFVLDPQRGAVLTWAVDGTGAAVAGVSAAATGDAVGPFYDGPTAGEIVEGGATRAHGLVALFDLVPPTATVRLATPAAAAVRGDQFTLPVRGGALTLSLLLLPPR